MVFLILGFFFLLKLKLQVHVPLSWLCLQSQLCGANELKWRERLVFKLTLRRTEFNIWIFIITRSCWHSAENLQKDSNLYSLVCPCMMPYSWDGLEVSQPLNIEEQIPAKGYLGLSLTPTWNKHLTCVSEMPYSFNVFLREGGELIGNRKIVDDRRNTFSYLTPSAFPRWSQTNHPGSSISPVKSRNKVCWLPPFPHTLKPLRDY